MSACRTAYADQGAGIPVGFMRVPGANWNTFVTESFVDELAHAASEDPLAFRLALLTQAATRERTVLELVAEARWSHPVTPGASQGIALATWGGSGAALVAECTVQGKDVRVHRAVIAANCAPSFIPTSSARSFDGRDRLRIVDGDESQDRVYERPRRSKQLLRLSSAADCGGIGELGTPPIAPAVGNAVFRATGKRVRRLPFGDALA